MERSENRAGDRARILLISADAAVRQQVEQALADTELDAALECLVQPCGNAARNAHVIVVDMSASGHAAYGKEGSAAPVILLCNAADESAARTAVRNGAHGYVLKDRGELSVLGRLVGAALREAHLEHRLLEVARQAALGQLVPIVAHEINNPLALITNNLYLLERDVGLLRDLLHLFQQAQPLLAATQPELAQQVRDFEAKIDLTYTMGGTDRLVERARNGLKRIQQMVRDLLTFGRGSDEVAEMDVNAAIETVLRLVQRRAEKQGVEVCTELAPVPRPTCSPALVCQVVMNLLLNAIEACSREGKVTVRTNATDEQIEIHILDTGHGVEPSMRERIFEPFVTTKSPAPGAGLGLPVARALVDGHGGHLDFTTSDAGCHFTVRLPYNKGTTKEL
jgi:two-component system, NtrC family, sensor kinase